MNRVDELVQARLLRIREWSRLLVASAVVESVRHDCVCSGVVRRLSVCDARRRRLSTDICGAVEMVNLVKVASERGSRGVKCERGGQDNVVEARVK